MPNPKVAIVILNYNGKDWLHQLLPSIVATTYNNANIIIADNASTDDSVAYVKLHYPTIEIIPLSTNLGFAQGYNVALAKVTADYFVLLNSDVEVTPNWLEPIITLLEQNKTIGACQPKILSYNKRTHFEYAGASGGYLDYLGYPLARGRVLHTCEQDNGQYNDAVPIFWASGAALVIRSGLYHSLGGLDATFFAHQEEIDLCWRIQLAGYKVYVCPQSIVYHVGGGTLQQGSALKTFLNFRNNLIMLYKNLPQAGKNAFILKRTLLNYAAAIQLLCKADLANAKAIWKAQKAYNSWKKENTLPCNNTVPLTQLAGVIPKSMVYQYYIKGKKTFSEIVHN